MAEKNSLSPIINSRYKAKLAETEEELEKALQLRYQIFYQELGRTFDEDATHDRDEFDDLCHHLLILTTDSNEVIGTYRMLTAEQLAGGTGFYSSTYYDLSPLHDDIFPKAIEVGRACIHPDHRNGRVLFLLWKGFAAYLQTYNKRYLFGSFGVPANSPAMALRTYQHFKDNGFLHPTIQCEVKPTYRLNEQSGETEVDPAVPPPLLQNYLDIGCCICSGPAYVSHLNLLHVMVYLDVHTISPAVRRMFFG
ncbi:MAG: GNAT family N-acetyltransferase [Balneolaceae bacterium]